MVADVNLLTCRDLGLPWIESVFELAAEPDSIPRLHGLRLATLFEEPSTRTRASFELAAKRLGMSVLNLEGDSSSLIKGESLRDTFHTLVQLGIDAVVLRQSGSGIPSDLPLPVINAGDGWHQHPTQALLDAFTLRQAGIRDRVAILGDHLHSRVSRSAVEMLEMLGSRVTLIGPPSLSPQAHYHDLEVALEAEQPEAIMVLRPQLERWQSRVSISRGDYVRRYRLSAYHLRNLPGTMVMHPGPVNRNFEISEELVEDSEISLIGQQVKNGIHVRMAVLGLLLEDFA